MNNEKERLLVVEDDLRMQQLLRAQLAARGFSVQAVGTGLAALAALAGATPPHLVLLDIGLPDMDGIETCRRMRAVSGVPIILVTAADDPRTKVTALELGADDYLTKPFYVEELAARVRAVLRRAGRPAAAAGSTAPLPAVIAVDNLRIDLTRREVNRAGVALHLTKTEFDLLRALVTHPDQVLSYASLLKAVWGGGEDVRPVHVHISHLRRKIEGGPTGPRRILSVPGVGYKFRPNGHPAAPVPAILSES